MNKLTAKKFAFALVGLLVVFAMGALKKEVQGDRSFYKINLMPNAEYTYEMDIAKMGGVKYLVQPNIMTLYLRLQVPEEVQNLHCDVEGVKAFVSQGSKKGVWKEVTVADKLRREKNFVPLNLELSVPRADINKRDVAIGKLHFYNEGKAYAAVAVKIINSKF